MKDNSSELTLKYVDQRFDSLEAWVKKGESSWVRLDFMLEYYVSGNVSLSKQYKDQLGDEKTAKQYYDSMLKKLTQHGHKFEIQKYLDWQRQNPAEINKAKNLLY